MVLATQAMRPPCRQRALISNPPMSTPNPLSRQLQILPVPHTRCRRDSSFSSSIWMIFVVVLLSFVPTRSHAFPVQSSVLLNTPPFLLPEFHILHRRRDPLIISNATGRPTVIDPATSATVPQGAATDAGGVGYDAPALIWVSFSLVVGLPMAIAGIRGWRLTTGVGVGLVGTVASWAAFVNSISPAPLSDLVLTSIILGFFLVLFAFGVFPYGRVAGITCIGLGGGTAFGVRVVILKGGLLIPDSAGYALNWVLVVLCSIVGGTSIIWERSQRGGLVFGCASIGTFLSFLGVDLLIHEQAGMSRGLRFLFDRNESHFLDIIGGGYTPPTVTQILIGASLCLTPIFAFGQHYFFKQPFSRKPLDEDENTLESDDEIDTNSEEARPTSAINANATNMNQKEHQLVSTRITIGSNFGLANTNAQNGFGAGTRLGQGMAHKVTSSGLWDSFRRK